MNHDPATRRAAAQRIAADEAASQRIAEAPDGYLLVHGSGDIARHAALLSPPPDADDVRVVVTPAREPGHWHVDVVAHDRPGLLASFTGALAESRIDVVQAVLATWDDGAALEAFLVRSPVPPSGPDLQDTFRAALARPLSSSAVAGAVVTFDHASDAYSGCEVRARDRTGLLSAIAVAFAAAGADVHAARVETVAGEVRDRFDLTDGAGGLLDADHERAIRDHLASGVTGLSSPRPRRRRRLSALVGRR